jgi:TPR repeat protein
MLTRREYKELYLLHYSKAESGNVESQFKLGEYYEHGNGVVKNYELATFWYQKAANGKHPMALFNLDWMRLKESGIGQNEGHLNLLANGKHSGKTHSPKCRGSMRLSNNANSTNKVLNGKPREHRY